MQFGWIIGGSIILFLVYLILNVLLSNKINIYWKEVSLLVISYSLVYKCLSGSYLNDPDALMMLGFLINAVFSHGLRQHKGLSTNKIPT